LKDAISGLPIATEDDDIDEAATLKDETAIGNDDYDNKQATVAAAEENNKDESDPFGLDALIPRSGKKDDRTKGKKDVAAKSIKEDEEETKRFLKSKREALITCLEIAARRYKVPWQVFIVFCSYFLFLLLTERKGNSTFYGSIILSFHFRKLIASVILLRCQTVIDILVKHASDNDGPH